MNLPVDQYCKRLASQCATTYKQLVKSPTATVAATETVGVYTLPRMLANRRADTPRGLALFVAKRRGRLNDRPTSDGANETQISQEQSMKTAIIAENHF